MCAADFYDIGKVIRLGIQRVAEFLDRGYEGLNNHGGRGDGHRRRECVVRGLRHVDIVVGVHWLFRALCTACDFYGAVGDDLVGVHVALRAGSGLPNPERKMRIQFSVNDLVGGLDDEIALFSGEFP